MEVHRFLGAGLLEDSYKQCLSHELCLQVIKLGLEVPLPVEYKGVKLECGCRLDLRVEDSLIVRITHELP
ncbi:MAG: GxxExxY protein [Thermodesulfobacteriota bacterium]